MFRSVLCALVALLLLPAVAAAGSELSTNDRLQDRRYVTAAERAYLEFLSARLNIPADRLSQLNAAV